MEEYFRTFSIGKLRAKQIIPQPFFVHSDLTTLIQVADLIAYILARGYVIPNSFLTVAREELRPFGNKVNSLRYDAKRALGANQTLLSGVLRRLTTCAVQRKTGLESKKAMWRCSAPKPPLGNLWA